MRKANCIKKAYDKPYYVIEIFTIRDTISTSSIDDGDDPMFPEGYDEDGKIF